MNEQEEWVVFEEEVELYNSRMRLETWLFDEVRMQPIDIREEVKKEGAKLPINLG